MLSYWACGRWFCWLITFWNFVLNIYGHFGSFSGVSTIHLSTKDWWVQHIICIFSLTKQINSPKYFSNPFSSKICKSLIFINTKQTKKMYLFSRHSQYSSFALPSHPTWFVFCLSRFIGCFLLPAPTFGSSMFGIQVSKYVLLVNSWNRHSIKILCHNFNVNYYYYRKGLLRTNSISVASVCLHRSFHKVERV